MNKRAGILGSGIATIIATLMIILILGIFTFVALTLNSLDTNSQIKIDRPLKANSTATQDMLKGDSTGLLKNYQETMLQKQLINLLGQKEMFLGLERSLSATVSLWDEDNTEDIIGYLEQLDHEIPYLEIEKDATIICTKNSCDVTESIKERAMSHLGQEEVEYLYTELKLSDVIISVSDIALTQETITATTNKKIYEDSTPP